ncbi:phospholipase D-like domain-containing protein [Propioniciclava coleopterorum]|uniref:phospholipase D-like domain-containing protein n=1 Tax=Propioniciclava coleopterorum TaxID=2714937 RepID=UPI001FE396D0|nr:phospholipase D-like domain-containing protein [Propioniciclava coleopterorum]
MVLGRVRTAAKVSLAALAAAQAGTIAALMVVDRRRKRHRGHVRFPSTPPRELPAGEDLLSVYTKGRDLYDDMIAAIDAAEHTIFLETYIWKGDRVGQRFKRALTEAAARGVEVHVVYDVFANLVVPQKFFRFDPRIHVLRHRPWTGARGPLSFRSPGLNHRKILVVDGTTAFLGGYNLGSLYATRWRDTHLRIRGAAAADLANAFVDYWNMARRGQRALPQPADRPWESSVRITRNVPSIGVYPIRYTYLEAIDRARDHIWLTHAYLIPDDDLTYALVEAADRGVDVRIIVPAESNHIVADWISRGFYTTLLRRGIRLFLYQDAMVHAKTATADGRWSVIGTANLDRLSLTGNYEINAEILDADVAAEMERIFEMDASNCIELTLEEWQTRSIAMKVSEAILSPLRHFL